MHLKCDCINGSFVNCIREPFLYSFGLHKLPGHKIFKEPRIRLFIKINNSVLFRIRFYIEDDDHKAVDFNRQTISFSYQLVKI